MKPDFDGWSDAPTSEVALTLFNDAKLLASVLVKSRAQDPTPAQIRAAMEEYGRPHLLVKECIQSANYEEIAREFGSKMDDGCYAFLTSVDERVMNALRSARIEDNQVFLAGSMARDVYVEVDKVLQRIGGKWNRKARAHVFEKDPADHLAHVVETGDLRYKIDANPHDFFATPGDLARELIRKYLGTDSLPPEARVLEPSVGEGAFAAEVLAICPTAHIDAYDIDELRLARLADRLPQVAAQCADFLELEAEPIYDLVVMNPPFANGIDARHIAHALRFLKPGGQLVAIASAGLEYRRGANHEGLRSIVNGSLPTIGFGVMERLPAKSFAQVGTDVSTVVFNIRRGAGVFHGFEPPRSRPSQLDLAETAEPARRRPSP